MSQRRVQWFDLALLVLATALFILQHVAVVQDVAHIHEVLLWEMTNMCCPCVSHMPFTSRCARVLWLGVVDYFVFSNVPYLVIRVKVSKDTPDGRGNRTVRSVVWSKS